MMNTAVRTLIAATAGALVLALATAAPAAADDSKYLNLLNGDEFYDRLGPNVLLQEGHKVCQLIATGTPDDIDLGRMVARDLSVSLFSASQVIAAANVGLGC